MLARFAILMLAVGVFLQPLLAGVHATDDCCAVPDGPAAAPSAEGEGGHECCDGETPQGADEGQPSDRDRDDRRPRGCDCPKSCCTGIVKVPLSVAPACVPAEWRDQIEQVFSDAPGPAGDAWTSRLKRPPRAVAAV